MCRREGNGRASEKIRGKDLIADLGDLFDLLSPVRLSVVSSQRLSL